MFIIKGSAKKKKKNLWLYSLALNNETKQKKKYTF
jgi:hypothetical protein